LTISDEALRLLNPWFLGFVGVLLGVAGWLVVRLLKNIERRIVDLTNGNERDFSRLEKKIDEDFLKLEGRIEGYRAESESRLNGVEQQFWEWRARLPERFVMRDDWIRNASTLELKIDRILNEMKSQRGNDEPTPTQQN